MKRTAVGATPWSSAACRWPAGTSSTLPLAARRRTRRRQISPRHFFQVSQLKEWLSFGTLTIRKRRTDKIATNKGVWKMTDSSTNLSTSSSTTTAFGDCRFDTVVGASYVAFLYPGHVLRHTRDTSCRSASSCLSSTSRSTRMPLIMLTFTLLAFSTWEVGESIAGWGDNHMPFPPMQLGCLRSVKLLRAMSPGRNRIKSYWL